MANRILVTGAGGDSGLAAIRILKASGFYVHACDCSDISSGLYLADSYSILPKASDEKTFLEEIKNIIKNNKIDIIFPNVDEELRIFAKYKDEIDAKIIISPLETINLCQNKLETINFLKGYIEVPRTNEAFEEFPLVIRPTVSRGSRNIYIAKNIKEKEFFLYYIKSLNLIPMIQEHLPGKEYTVDCLFDENGKLIVLSARERMSTKGGISLVGKTVKEERINKIIEIIGEKIRFFGPVNIQLKEDKDGVLKLIEINPRCSGGLPITYKNELNIPLLAVKIAKGEYISPSELSYKEGIVFRYLSEV